MPRLGRARRNSSVFSVGAAAPAAPGSNDRWGSLVWGELETPSAVPDSDGRLFWAEFEGPTASRLGRLTWAESEVPTAGSRFGEIDWSEFEVPSGPRAGSVSWAEMGTGSPGGISGILINARLVYIKPLRPHRKLPHLPNVFVPIDDPWEGHQY